MRTLFVGLLAIAACAIETHATDTSSEDEAPQQAERPQSACPMMIPGATVALRDAGGGVALVFTTTSGDVDELRMRVERMGELHHSGQMMLIADTEVRVEDVEEGAQIVFLPSDAEQMARMRIHLQRALINLESGFCPSEEIASK